ncbi:MAG: DsbA family protein [Pseudomonadota bacterium]|nr:DsbA family protein [Pseudomonadota bacterium]
MERRFFYFADPMCSWCWGFVPNVEKLVAAWPDIPVRLVMGGLYPGVTKPMAEHRKAEVRKHWEHVTEATGQPFDYGFFDRQGFVYNTEPASRALITAKRLSGTQALGFLEELQGAFYRDNRDVTDAAVLLDIAAEQGFDRETFRESFESDTMRQLTERDFHFARQLGVTGFPTLLGFDGERYRLLSMGYQDWDWLQKVIERWMERSAAEQQTTVH